MTPQEIKLWTRLRTLRSLGYHFRRQRPHRGYILDFVCLQHNLVVEIDGGQHARPARTPADLRRDRQLRSDRMRVLRFWNGEVDDLDVVLDTVPALLRGTPPTGLRPVPPPRAGEG
jgi:very-short-patch-repair endonuclease